MLEGNLPREGGDLWPQGLVPCTAQPPASRPPLSPGPRDRPGGAPLTCHSTCRSTPPLPRGCGCGSASAGFPHFLPEDGARGAEGQRLSSSQARRCSGPRPLLHAPGGGGSVLQEVTKGRRAGPQAPRCCPARTAPRVRPSGDFVSLRRQHTVPPSPPARVGCAAVTEAQGSLGLTAGAPLRRTPRVRLALLRSRAAVGSCPHGLCVRRCCGIRCIFLSVKTALASRETTSSFLGDVFRSKV